MFDLSVGNVKTFEREPESECSFLCSQGMFVCINEALPVCGGDDDLIRMYIYIYYHKYFIIYIFLISKGPCIRAAKNIWA